MIELYDIIEAANATIPKSKGQLVLHRGFQVHPKFKVYKKFYYNLYLIHNSESTLIDSKEFTENVQSNDIDEIWKRCDKVYLISIIDWFTSNEYKKLRYV